MVESVRRLLAHMSLLPANNQLCFREDKISYLRLDPTSGLKEVRIMGLRLFLTAKKSFNLCLALILQQFGV